MKKHFYSICENGEVHERYLDCQIEIGDVVELTNIGHVYPAYRRAFNAMHGESYKFKNYINLDNIYHDFLPSTNFQDETTHGTKKGLGNWIVLDMCLHELGCDVIYLIGNGKTKCGLMINEGGIKLIHSSHKDTKTIYEYVKNK